MARRQKALCARVRRLRADPRASRKKHGQQGDRSHSPQTHWKRTGRALFFEPRDGPQIVRNHWTELPAPADAIARVEKLAECQQTNRLTFGDRNNVEREIDDDTDVMSIAGSDNAESEAKTNSEGRRHA